MSCATLRRVEGRDPRRIESGERRPVAIALVEYRRPRKAGLRAFEDEKLEEHAIVVNGHSPLVIVVRGVGRAAVGPRAAE